MNEILLNITYVLGNYGAGLIFSMNDDNDGLAAFGYLYLIMTPVCTLMMFVYNLYHIDSSVSGMPNFVWGALAIVTGIGTAARLCWKVRSLWKL